jgi:hypothetical protein
MAIMEVIAGELYEHYTGKLYRVITLGMMEHPKNKEKTKVMVVFRSEADPSLVYIRPHIQFRRKYKLVASGKK